jgi:dihydroorotase-like cyclic amidohydrolase
VSAISVNVATRFRLPANGAIAVGRDADLVLVDLSRSWTLARDELLYRHPLSALVGQPMRGAVRHVFSRGREVRPRAGRETDRGRGHRLRPHV